MREMKQLVEWESAGETEVLGGSFPQRHRPPKIPRELICELTRTAELRTRQAAETLAYFPFLLVTARLRCFFFIALKKCLSRGPQSCIDVANSLKWHHGVESFLKATSRSASPEVFSISWNLKIHCRFQKSPPLILSYIYQSIHPKLYLWHPF